MMSSLSKWAVALVCTAAVLPAQRVWNVANQSEFLHALDWARPGDVIQLDENGVYGDFTMDRGLTIRGPGVIGGNFGETGKRFATIPAGEMAQFVDVAFVPNSLTMEYPSQGSLEVSGVVRFDGCALTGATFEGALIARDADVVVQRCTLAGSEHALALRSIDSNVVITDSVLKGAGARGTYFYATSASAAVVTTGTGSLHLSAVTVTGGDGLYAWGYGIWPPAPGIDTAVPTWLCDATVVGGSIEGPVSGGTALVAATTVWSTRCTLAGGSGDPVGSASQGDVRDEPSLPGASAPAPLIRGAPWTMIIQAEGVGVALAVVAWTPLGAAAAHPLVVQPTWFGGAPVLVTGGLTDGSGALRLTWPVPNDPVLANVGFDLAGLRVAGTRLQASPVVGGVVR